MAIQSAPSNIVYRTMLKLYPAEFQAMFAAEMREVFTEASEAQGKGLFSARLPYATAQCFGLLKGALREYMAKWASADRYLQRSCTWRDVRDLQDEAELRQYIDGLVGSMTLAIARHNFSQARFYSGEERTARAHLERLLQRKTAIERSEGHFQEGR